MPNWVDKLKAIAVPAAKIAGAVAPAPVGNVAKVVEQILGDPDKPDSDAVRQLAQAVVNLEARVANLEAAVIRRSS